MTYLLQRVVFPIERDPDLLALYYDPDDWAVIDGQAVRMSSNVHLDDVIDRHQLRIAESRRVSFASYFNAFPASYWQHWTTVTEVTLNVRVSGNGTLMLIRSNGSAVQQREASVEFAGVESFALTVPLKHFSDGGWIWFDIESGDSGATLLGAEWVTSDAPARTGNASIGITTFNKPDYCIATLNALAGDSAATDVIDTVYVIDQGTQLVSEQPGFADVAGELNGKLSVIQQPNLGGSGGFARSMLETLSAGKSTFVQLLDDDVRIDTEALRRSIVFGRFCSKPTIVGAHMFDLLDRTRLHAWAEVVDDHSFMWRNLYQEQMPHDFSRSNLRQTRLLHQRLDADYNGWWMCLIPIEIIREVGLALPAFIKWDDAEYALRAREAGFATASLPGVALWHVSWVGKDDTIDWQAYFHARNRIVAALLHSHSERGGSLLTHSRRVDLKHLMMMQYYPAELRMRAIADVLSGPSHMWDTLSTAMPAARALQADYPETLVHRERDGLIYSRQGRLTFPLVEHERELDTPTGFRLRWFTLSTLVKNWVRPVRPSAIERPEVEFSKFDARWWRVPRFDSAIVSAADGSGKNVYIRDRQKFRALMRQSAKLHRELRHRWPDLSAEYRREITHLTSPDSWKRVFEQ